MPDTPNILSESTVGIFNSNLLATKLDTQERINSLFTNFNIPPIQEPSEYIPKNMSGDDLLTNKNFPTIADYLTSADPAVRQIGKQYQDKIVAKDQSLSKGYGLPNMVRYQEGQDKFTGKKYGFNPYSSLMENEDFYHKNVWDNYSFVGKAWRGVGTFAGRVATKFVTGLVGMVGDLGSMAWNGLEEAIDPNGNNFWADVSDNWLARKMEQANDYIKNDILPTYKAINYDQKGAFSKVADPYWWMNDAADGVGFLLQFAVPSTYLGKIARIAKEAELAGAISKYGKFGELIAKEATGTGAKALEFFTGARNVGGVASHIFNTTMESVQETKNGFDQTVKDLIEKGYTKEEAKRKAAEDAPQQFWLNMGILSISNALENKWFQQASGNRVLKGLHVNEAGDVVKPIPVTKLGKFFAENKWGKRIAFYGPEAAKAQLFEGWWEENAQQAAQRVAQGEYMRYGDDTLTTGEYTKTPKDRTWYGEMFKQLAKQSYDASWWGKGDREVADSIMAGAVIGILGSVGFAKLTPSNAPRTIGKDGKYIKPSFIQGLREGGERRNKERTHEKFFTTMKNAKDAWMNMDVWQNDLIDDDGSYNSEKAKAKITEINAKLQQIQSVAQRQVGIEDILDPNLRNRAKHVLFGDLVKAHIQNGSIDEFINRMRDWGNKTSAELDMYGVTPEIKEDPHYWVTVAESMKKLYENLDEIKWQNPENLSPSDYLGRLEALKSHIFDLHSQRNAAEKASTGMTLQQHAISPFKSLPSLNDYNQKVIEISRLQQTLENNRGRLSDEDRAQYKAQLTELTTQLENDKKLLPEHDEHRGLVFEKGSDAATQFKTIQQQVNEWLFNKDNVEVFGKVIQSIDNKLAQLKDPATGLSRFADEITSHNDAITKYKEKVILSKGWTLDEISKMSEEEKNNILQNNLIKEGKEEEIKKAEEEAKKKAEEEAKPFTIEELEPIAISIIQKIDGSVNVENFPDFISKLGKMLEDNPDLFTDDEMDIISEYAKLRAQQEMNKAFEKLAEEMNKEAEIEKNKQEIRQKELEALPFDEDTQLRLTAYKEKGDMERYMRELINAADKLKEGSIIINKHKAEDALTNPDSTIAERIMARQYLEDNTKPYNEAQLSDINKLINTELSTVGLGEGKAYWTDSTRALKKLYDEEMTLQKTKEEDEAIIREAQARESINQELSAEEEAKQILELEKEIEKAEQELNTSTEEKTLEEIETAAIQQAEDLSEKVASTEPIVIVLESGLPVAPEVVVQPIITSQDAEETVDNTVSSTVDSVVDDTVTQEEEEKIAAEEGISIKKVKPSIAKVIKNVFKGIRLPKMGKTMSRIIKRILKWFIAMTLSLVILHQTPIWDKVVKNAVRTVQSIQSTNRDTAYFNTVGYYVTPFDGCAAWTHNQVEMITSTEARDKLNLYGDAWTSTYNMVASGHGSYVYNVFQNVYKPTLLSADSITNWIKGLITKSSVPTDFKAGDIINFFYEGSSATVKAFTEGKGVYTSHLGIVKYNDEGRLVIEHNIHSTIKTNEISDIINGKVHSVHGILRIAAVARPDYKSIGFEVAAPQPIKAPKKGSDIAALLGLSALAVVRRKRENGEPITKEDIDAMKKELEELKALKEKKDAERAAEQQRKEDLAEKMNSPEVVASRTSAEQQASGNPITIPQVVGPQAVVHTAVPPKPPESTDDSILGESYLDEIREAYRLHQLAVEKDTTFKEEAEEEGMKFHNNRLDNHVDEGKIEGKINIISSNPKDIENEQIKLGEDNKNLIRFNFVDNLLSGKLNKANFRISLTLSKNNNIYGLVTDVNGNIVPIDNKGMPSKTGVPLDFFLDSDMFGTSNLAKRRSDVVKPSFQIAPLTAMPVILHPSFVGKDVINIIKNRIKKQKVLASVNFVTQGVLYRKGVKNDFQIPKGEAISSAFDLIQKGHLRDEKGMMSGVDEIVRGTYRRGNRIHFALYKDLNNHDAGVETAEFKPVQIKNAVNEKGEKIIDNLMVEVKGRKMNIFQAAVEGNLEPTSAHMTTLETLLRPDKFKVLNLGSTLLLVNLPRFKKFLTKENPTIGDLRALTTVDDVLNSELNIRKPIYDMEGEAKLMDGLLEKGNRNYMHFINRNVMTSAELIKKGDTEGYARINKRLALSLIDDMETLSKDNNQKEQENKSQAVTEIKLDEELSDAEALKILMNEGDTSSIDYEELVKRCE